MGRADRGWRCSALAAALVAVVLVAGRSELTAAGALAVDGPALFLQGTLLVLGLLSVLLLAERSLDVGGGAFVAQAAVVAGAQRGPAERSPRPGCRPSSSRWPPSRSPA